MQDDHANKTQPDTGSYRSILKSTSLIGGASFINILIGMVKTKFVATLLGPTGVGLMGMYSQIIGVVGTLTGMGLSSSGVRQVAEAVGTSDDERVARTVKTLRRTVWLTGGAGMLVMVLACVPISMVTFDNDDYALSIAFLGIIILLAAITSGQACVLQGTRRIADLAKISVIGATNGTLISIPCFYLWGEKGIVVSLILCSVASLATSWWFARRVEIKPIDLPWNDSVGEAKQMLVLGVSFMGAGLVTALSMYLIRVILVRQFDLNDVGIYQAAFVLSGVLVGFVLKAMGTDYYPRLTAAAQDNEQVHRMVNEQTEISLLMALPMLVAMMIFAPMIIRVFYAEAFSTATPILRWCLLGVLGKVLSWPLSLVMVAKNRGQLFFVLEVLAAGFHIVAVFSFVKYWGIDGAGMAFMALYVFYTTLMLFFIKRLVGSTWRRTTLHLSFGSIIIMSMILISYNFQISPIFRWLIELSVLAFVSFFCCFQLSRKSGININSLLKKIKR